MAAIANIVVKKNDGTTDITYSAVVGSGGDKSPAIWRSTSVGYASGHQPEVKMSARPNGAGNGRRVDINYVYPMLLTDGNTGLTTVTTKATATVSVFVPADMQTVDVDEAVSQMVNLLSSTLFKSSLKSGFAPT